VAAAAYGQYPVTNRVSSNSVWLIEITPPHNIERAKDLKHALHEETPRQAHEQPDFAGTITSMFDLAIMSVLPQAFFTASCSPKFLMAEDDTRTKRVKAMTFLSLLGAGTPGSRNRVRTDGLGDAQEHSPQHRAGISRCRPARRR